MVRVLLVDDHDVVRMGLKMYFSLDEDIQVVAEASNGQEALEAIPSCNPDVVIMDLMMPVMDGVKATKELRKMHPGIEVLALTSALEEHRIHAAIEAGAIGYMLKDASAETLLEAIHAAARGEVRLHPEVAKRLVREFRSPQMRESLTNRETLTLQMIARGMTNKHIAEQLEVSETTVKTHVSSLLSKLNLGSRTQAALYALKHNIVALEDL
ncbi:response regulator [Deinococcus misasensis]|uniref:response regulator n=1 Tax=Deinococcus misasensis TaxID=392413 RepID=UPI0005504C2F|nr:response regulator transcription factor [Deinococcus misasensis]